MRRLAWGLGALVVVGVAVACGSGGDASTFPDTTDSGTFEEPTSPPAPFGTTDAMVNDATPSDGGIVDCDAEPGACLPPGVCGDGKAGLGESCDDGNKVSGDGCSASCQIEAPYWACAFGQKCVDVRDCAALADAGLATADGGCAPPPKPAVCGDKVIDPGEACDDGNVTGGDGCSFDCTTIEANFACPTPGQPCVSTVVCGDGKVTGTEQCDDGNLTNGDGCTSSCQLVAGWACLVPGTACTAKQCGDGLVAGAEECDDGNTSDGDGCSAACRLQSKTTSVPPGANTPPSTTITHYDCNYPAIPLVPLRQVCAPTTCGNGVREGTEQCDDSNTAPLDGCSPNCELEPTCPNGKCIARCGDGLLFDFDADGDGKPDEQCDDGNTRDGDGCSATCKVEVGYDCATQVADFPTYLDVPVVFRDFKYASAADFEAHPDFESYACPYVTPGLTQSTLTSGVPVFRWNGVGVDPDTGTDTNTAECGRQLTSATDFTDWYRDIDVTVGGQPRRRSKKITGFQVRLTRQGAAGNYSYVFDSKVDDPYKTRGGFFPIDGLGWGNQGAGHNFAFTTELRYWFTYDATVAPQLDFSGDDDVWVYINNRRALDVGGLHSIQSRSFVLDAAKATELGLVDKHVYEIALFHAERHTNDSNFKLTLRGFVRKGSVCSNVCGDGIKTREEQCDLAANNMPPAAVAYGGCTTECKLGPYCGDKTVQNPPEQCDDGVNLTPWTPATPVNQCGPGCKKPTYCGDGIVQSTSGERCDNGAANTDDPNKYNVCRTTCQPGPRCGDGIAQAQFGEQCDNGFNITSYVKTPSPSDCAPGCKKPRSCGDGAVDFPFEQCDQGANNTDSGAYGSCTTSCTLGPRCGDGVLQAPETCDDGNRLNGDGCSAACALEGNVK